MLLQGGMATFNRSQQMWLQLNQTEKDFSEDFSAGVDVQKETVLYS